MKISILIVTRKWIPDVHAFNYIKELKHNNIDFELLVAEGNNPSSQRNQLAQKAEGDYLLFLDDDSLPIDGLLERYQDTLQIYPETEIMGGPSVLSTKDNILSELSRIFFSSVFGIGPVRNRYNSLGAVRKATERDLILCNLLMGKAFFLKTNGFNQDLYPGEENEFLKNHQSKANVIYDPNAIVYREPRDSLFLFWKQMFDYGKGRSKHLKLNYLFDYVFLIPLIFSFYILFLPLILKLDFLFYIPLILYVVISFSVIARYQDTSLRGYQKLMIPFFFFIGHFSYGMGVTIGLVKYKILNRLLGIKKPLATIKIYELKNFKKSST